MMMPTYKNVNNRFKLNGFHLNKDDLCRVAYSFIKEGEDYEKPVGDFIIDWFDEKPYIEMLTSGSTGVPKTIRVAKQAMVHSALATGDFFDLHPGDKALHCLPTKYVAGKMMFVRAFILGLELEFVSPSAHPFDGVNGTFDFVAMVPMQAKNEIKNLYRAKKIIIGGAKVETDLANELEQVNSAIYETYGMTETITHIAAKRIGAEAFTVFPNIMLSQDENNCLLIHAPLLSDEIIHTNDIVEMVSDNQFKFLGRKDNMINSGGIKLIPEVIESKLKEFIPKRRFFVSSKPDATLGEKLVLIIEGEPIQIAIKTSKKMDKYEIPKEIYFVPKFEYTPTGKLMRNNTLKHITF